MRRCGLLLVLLLAVACAPADGRTRVFLVTTTTVEGSGLLDTLVAAYHASQDAYRLSTTAVGTGAALELGRRGDADVLLTHDPAGEAAFMAEGHGARQGTVMRNEFVVAGPPEDPASIRGVPSLPDALARIADAGSPFISRGDDSGTHRKERALLAGRPRWEAYVEAGSGMAETLRIADQRRAYVLTDLGTYRHLADRLELDLLARGDPPEPNAYRYTLPVRPPHPDAARDFVAWLIGPGQAVIGAWGRDRFGEPLFQPAADPAGAP